MLTSVFVTASVIFIVCCLLSVWLLGAIGYMTTVTSLFTATITYAVLNVTGPDGISVKALFTPSTVLLFFLYVVTAKHLMGDKFLTILTANEFKRFLLKNEKYRLPYTIITFLPHVLVFMLFLYVLIILIPASFGA